MANKPPISITGSNQETKVRSDDDDVMIGAFDCRVHIEGRVNRLEIRGNDNEVGVAGDLRDLQVKGHNAIVHVVGNIYHGVVTGRNAVIRSTETYRESRLKASTVSSYVLIPKLVVAARPTVAEGSMRTCPTVADGEALVPGPPHHPRPTVVTLPPNPQ